MTAKRVERFLCADDLTPAQSWELARWCLSRGASEFTVAMLGLQGREFCDRVRALLRPFELPPAPRGWRAEELVHDTELWALTEETITILGEFFDEGLFTYPVGESGAGEIEDPTIYRAGEMMLEIISHEREGVLRVTAEEYREIESLGIPTRSEAPWI